MHKKSLLSAFFLCCAGLYGSQLYAEDCDALVSSCNFETKTTGNDILDDVITKGFGTSKIVVNNEILSPISSPVDMGSNFYCITSNPHQLNDDFIDVDKKMFVAYVPSSVSPNEKLVTYQVNGLKPGSDFEIKFTFYHVNQTGYNENQPYLTEIETNMEVGVLCDAYGRPAAGKSENINVKTGESKEFVLKGTLPENIDYINLDFLANYNFQPCTFGISDIEVKGCYVPEIVTTTGYESCAGESAFFQLSEDYTGSSFEWMMKEPNGEFKSVGIEKNLLIELDEVGTYSFYCLVDGMESNIINVQTKSCCVINEVPVSLQYIINEDFGYFIDDHKYVDSEGNVTTTPDSYASERADVNWDLKKLSGMAFDSCGQVNDGKYGVVVPRSEGFYYKSDSKDVQANWWNGVVSDHSVYNSGKSRGGALFINVADRYEGPIYSKQIDNLCKGKDLIASAYIANLSDAKNGPIVALSIKDANTDKILAYNEDTVGVGEGWVKLSIGCTTESDSPIVFEIITLGDTTKKDFWTSGNDLIIDDITLSTCVPPTVNLFTSEAYDKDIIITKEDSITLTVPVTDILEKFYEGNQKYLFQQSVDNKNWTNLSKVSSWNYLTIASKDFSADINYFRVVVAPQSFADLIYEQPDLADFNEICRAYTVSQSIKIVKQIPECNIEAPSFVDKEKLVCYGSTYRNKFETFNSVTKDSIAFWLTYFDEYVIKSNDNYDLLWSKTENGPWTNETPVYDSRSEDYPNGDFVYYVKQTDGDCESEAARLVVIYDENTEVPNVVDNTLSYYVDNQKLVVNAKAGSNIVVYTTIGSRIAAQTISGSVSFDVKGQSIVILNVDGKSYKIVVK